MDRKRGLLKIIAGILLFIAIVFIILPEAYEYIYGYFLFRRIGQNLTVNMPEDFDKATNVAFWVFDNIKGFSRQQQHEFMPSIDDTAFGIYRRGFGYCDQSAHVYATIMHYLGFKVQLLMLINEKKISPHTVAVVDVEGKPMVVDTAYKFIFADNDKNPLPVEEFKNSEVFDEYLAVVRGLNANLKIDRPEFKSAWFKNGIYYKTFPYCGRQYILKKIKNKIKQRLTGKAH